MRLLLTRRRVEAVPVPDLHDTRACHRPLTIAEHYRRGRHVVSPLHAHLAFVTKYRRGVPGTGMLQCCEDTMRKVCAGFGAELREFNGEASHVTCWSTSRPRWRCRNS